VKIIIAQQSARKKKPVGSAVPYRLTTLLPYAQTPDECQDKQVGLTPSVQLYFGECNFSINSITLGLTGNSIHTNGVCAQINFASAALETSLTKEPMQTWDG